MTGRGMTLKEIHKKKILARLPKRDNSIWNVNNQWSKQKDTWNFPSQVEEYKGEDAEDKEKEDDNE